MAGRATGKTEVKGNNYFEHNFGGETFTFFISDEDASRINTDDIKQRTTENINLGIEARNVLNNEYMFGTIDVKKLSERYAFRPFKYQISNVEKMLNRFRGRGVFGDQVGLGKTIEALMTAHAMFESGAIRNALFVVGEKTIPGWVNEVLTKFTDIFKIHIPEDAFSLTEENSNHAISLKSVYDIARGRSDVLELIRFGSIEEEDDDHLIARFVSTRNSNNPIQNRLASVFVRLIQKIKEDNSKSSDSKRYNIYIATQEMLSASGNVLGSMADDIEENREYNRPVEAWQKTIIDNFVSKMRSVNFANQDRASVESFFSKLEIGRSKSKEYTFSSFVDAISEGCYVSTARLLCSKFEELMRRYDHMSDWDYVQASRMRENRPIVSGYFGKIKMLVEKYEEENEKRKNRMTLFGDPRIIDLMVIDEIHKIYDSNNDRSSRAMAELLSFIPKKFCVLISATPVRTRLDDIFELIYIADPKMLGGKNYNEAKNYFYQTLCRIESSTNYANRNSVNDTGAVNGEKYPLVDMILDDYYISDEKLKVFLGLINGFFTRKRSKDKDVLEDMRGIYGKTYDSLDDVQKRIIASIAIGVVRKRYIMYVKSGKVGERSALINKASADFNEWIQCKREENLFAKSALERAGLDMKDAPLSDEENKLFKKEQENKQRHFFSAIDATLIEIINVIDTLVFEHFKGELKSAVRRIHDHTKTLVVLAFNAFQSRSKIENIACDSDGMDRLEQGSIYNNVDDALVNIIAGNSKARKKTSELGAFKQMLYSMINWSRRDKFGLAFVPQKEHERGLIKSNAVRTEAGARALNLLDSLRKCTFGNTFETDGGRFIFPQGISPQTPNDDYDDNFFKSIMFDTVMASFGTPSEEELTDIINAIKNKSAIDMKANNAFCDLYKSINYASGAVTREVGVEGQFSINEDINRFSLVDDNYKAGVNLQQYKSFIFFSMEDDRGTRIRRGESRHNLLSPADIEQWIGRIHRTGQVKNCRIMTVVGHYPGQSYPDGFLEWYYNLLADPDGLDIYGNSSVLVSKDENKRGSADIAFIQPIASDFIRQALRNNDVGGDLKSLEFPQLAEKCYEYDMERKNIAGGGKDGDVMCKFVENTIILLRNIGFGDGNDLDELTRKVLIDHIHDVLTPKNQLINYLKRRNVSSSKSKRSK